MVNFGSLDRHFRAQVGWSEMRLPGSTPCKISATKLLSHSSSLLLMAASIRGFQYPESMRKHFSENFAALVKQLILTISTELLTFHKL